MRRETIVGAANMLTLARRASASNTRCGSNEPDRMTLLEPRAMCASPYSPEPCVSGAACRMVSPGPMKSMSA